MFCVYPETLLALFCLDENRKICLSELSVMFFPEVEDPVISHLFPCRLPHIKSGSPLPISGKGWYTKRAGKLRQCFLFFYFRIPQWNPFKKLLLQVMPYYWKELLKRPFQADFRDYETICNHAMTKIARQVIKNPVGISFPTGFFMEYNRKDQNEFNTFCN